MFDIFFNILYIVVRDPCEIRKSIGSSMDRSKDQHFPLSFHDELLGDHKRIGSEVKWWSFALWSVYVYYSPSLRYDCFNENSVQIYMEQLVQTYKQIYCFLTSVIHLFTDTIMIVFLIKTVNFFIMYIYLEHGEIKKAIICNLCVVKLVKKQKQNNPVVYFYMIRKWHWQFFTSSTIKKRLKILARLSLSFQLLIDFLTG